jgi:hypothetical protein
LNQQAGKLRDSAEVIVKKGREFIGPHCNPVKVDAEAQNQAYRKRGGRIWADNNSETVLPGKELKDALDYLCDSLHHVDSGTGQLVHAWWFHPHPVDYCRGNTSDKPHSGAETLVAGAASHERRNLMLSKPDISKSPRSLCTMLRIHESL